MANGIRCTCARCTMKGLMGPVVLITLGTLFLVGKFGWDLNFIKLWPVLLIVIGVVKLLESMASSEGHVGKDATPPAVAGGGQTMGPGPTPPASPQG